MPGFSFALEDCGACDVVAAMEGAQTAPAIVQPARKIQIFDVEKRIVGRFAATMPSPWVDRSVIL